MTFAESRKKYLIAIGASILLRYAALAFLFDSAGLHQGDAALGGIRSLRQLCGYDCAHLAQIVDKLEPTAFFPLFSILARFSVGLFHSDPFESVLIFSWILNLLFTGPLVLSLGEAYRERNTSLMPAIQGRHFLGWSYFSWLLLLLFSVFPHSHFLIRGYSESLFLPLLLLSLIAVFRERWSLAALALGLSAVTRAQGAWCAAIYGAYRLCLLYRRPSASSASGRLESAPTKEGLRANFGGRCALGMALEATLLAAPFLLMLLWDQARTGDWFFVFHEHEKWGQGFSLLPAVRAHLPKFEDSHLFLLLSWIGAAFFFRNARALRDPALAYLAAFTLAMAEAPLFLGGATPLFSYSRYVSMNVGVFLLIADFLVRRPVLIPPVAMWMCARLGIQTYHFTFGHWTG